jgi:hypothetical protein
MSVELGYWGIRGLGAPLRMTLSYAGVRSTLILPVPHATHPRHDTKHARVAARAIGALPAACYKR